MGKELSFSIVMVHFGNSGVKPTVGKKSIPRPPGRIRRDIFAPP
jgi:hypothetical protein